MKSNKVTLNGSSLNLRRTRNPLKSKKSAKGKLRAKTGKSSQRSIHPASRKSTRAARTRPTKALKTDKRSPSKNLIDGVPYLA